MKLVNRAEKPSRIVAGFNTAKAALTLAYVTLLYWLVGVPEEYYRVKKGNAWCDLRCYSRAIKNYEKALKEKEASMVRAAIGWCYAQLGKNESSVYHYRLAYSQDKSAVVAIGLALAEYGIGNVGESRRVFEGITNANSTNYGQYASEIEGLRKRLYP